MAEDADHGPHPPQQRARRAATVAESARAFAQASRAANTLRSQASQWRRFTAWCAGHGLLSLPTAPETVALYLAASAETLKAGSQTGKAALLPVDLRALVAACGEDQRGLRNRATLLFGFASALRRSELVALDVADLTFSRQGESANISHGSV